MNLRRATFLTLRLGVLTATTGLIFFASFYLSARWLIFGNEVTVPDLRGISVEDSRSRLDGLDLKLATERERYDPLVPAGEIIEQTPKPGNITKTRRTVRVTVSLGTQILAVPDLTNRTERRALLDLEASGLQPGALARATSSKPHRRVMAQDPEPGADTLGGEDVNLLVSRGPADAVYVMPDLKGLPVERVRRALRTYGLGLSDSRTEPSWSPEGTILKQFPEPGYPVSRRDTISVVVSG